jgi:hypothetical protein
MPSVSSSLSSAPVAPSDDAADVRRVLLGAAEIGAGFVRADNDGPAPLPCTPHDPPVDDQVRHVEKGGVVYVNDVQGVQVSEQVYVYDSTAAAVRHQRIAEKGLACTHGTLDGRPITVLGPSDVRSQLRERSQAAEVWVVKTDQVSGALIAVRIHAVVIQFAVVAEKGASSNVDAKQVVETGLAKITAAAG